MDRTASTTLALSAALSLFAAACADDSPDPCATPLTEDLVNANPVYTADGDPLVILRLDLAGTCAGTGDETFVIYRPDGLEISTVAVAIDPMMVPEHDTGTTLYLYRTDGVTLDIQRAGSTDVTLVFIEGSGPPPAVRCREVDGFLSCGEV